MQKIEKRKKIIQRVLSALSIVLILVCVVVVPVSAMSMEDSDFTLIPMYAYTPIKTISTDLNVFVMDNNADLDPYENVDLNVLINPQNTYNIPNYAVSSISPGEIVRYESNVGLRSPSDYSLPVSKTFSQAFYVESNYLNSARAKYPNYNFMVSRTFIPYLGSAPTNKDSTKIKFEFEELMYYEHTMPSPYLVFDKSVHKYEGVEVKVTYTYDLLTVVGDSYDFISKTNTVKPTAFNSSGRIDLFPNALRNNEKNSPFVIKNLVAEVEFYMQDTLEKEGFRDFYIQQAFVDHKFNDLENLFNDYGKITKWRNVSDITSWIGGTVSGFFNIEIFPGIYLTSVLGIVIMVSVVTWVLKLMAGG